jgi:hypothetical protein
MIEGQMDKKAKIKLELVDVFGKAITEKADVVVNCLDLTDKQRVADADASAAFIIPGLFGPPRNRYRVDIDLPGYRSVTFIKNATEAKNPDTHVVFFAVDPRRVIRAEFPTFANLADEARTLLEQSDNVLSAEGKTGKALYEELDDQRRAGFLNIISKCKRTVFSNGKSVLSFLADPVAKLSEIRGDRFFLSVPKALREETKNSVANNVFDKASALLHHPPKDFKTAGSFKTPDRAGNLQLSFHAKGDNFVADIDIDDANGFEHVFQLINNIGGATHPYNIHQILVKTQEIDPGYRLFVR